MLMFPALPSFIAFNDVRMALTTTWYATEESMLIDRQFLVQLRAKLP